MKPFSECTPEELILPGGYLCDCGRRHETGIEYLKIGPGAIACVPEALRALGAKKPLVVCDKNTKQAAWEQLRAVLEGAGVAYSLLELHQKDVEPDEFSVGAICMDMDASCDIMLALGSGVINDLCRVVAHARGQKSMVVGTAPSMDGYASDSSAMIRDRIKVSLYSKCPAAIIADTEIMRRAPLRMLKAGLGDVLAKYVAQCEWGISRLVTGEYYCANIAGLVRESVRRCVAGADGLLKRKEESVREVVNGLILSGIAMSYAKISRPASGLEHYFSHAWEMMALERGTPYELHGIQVGVGTYLTLKLYERIRVLAPSREKAERFVREFSDEAWLAQTMRIFGKAADAIIRLEEMEHKNDKALHAKRLNNILAHWDEIATIIDTELPPASDIEALMRKLDMPMTPRDIGIAPEDVKNAFIGSRDIRNKYLTSTLLWDLGELYDMAEIVDTL